MDFASLGQADVALFLIILVIALVALIVTRKLLHVAFPYFFMGVLGATAGLILGNVVGKILIKLPGSYGVWLPMIIQVFIAVAIFDLFIAQARPAARFFASLFANPETIGRSENIEIVIDTSALIDGRIEEIVNSGFIFGHLIVPKFILDELQKIADSEDNLKRTKGRMGLEVLGNIQKNRQIIIEISDEKLRERDRVDNKLVKLAKERGAKLMSVDNNLLQVAQIQGVEILNIHVLAQAMKPLLIPGEFIKIKVVQKGKERKQGIGYLDDGTLVIVEEGDKYIGEEVNSEVVRIHQTVTGKMVFVQPKK